MSLDVQRKRKGYRLGCPIKEERGGGSGLRLIAPFLHGSLENVRACKLNKI